MIIFDEKKFRLKVNFGGNVDDIGGVGGGGGFTGFDPDTYEKPEGSFGTFQNPWGGKVKDSTDSGFRNTPTQVVGRGGMVKRSDK